MRDVLGYDPDAIRITRDGCLDAIHWADRDGYMEALRRSARTLGSYTEEFRAITADGEVKWLSGTARADRMPNGDIMWDGVLIDVTDRIRAEQRLEMIMDHAADCIVTISQDGIIETVNAATSRAFGWSEQELVGRNFGTLMTESERVRHNAFMEQYVNTAMPGCSTAALGSYRLSTATARSFPSSSPCRKF